MTETIVALWPEYRDIPNSLPESAQVTSMQMVSFFLFFLIQIPFHLIPMEQLRTLFLAKAVLLIPVSCGMVLRASFSQIPIIPVVKTLYAVLGIATVGAGRTAYNEEIWSPIQLLPKWGGSGGRFLAFCCGCLWMLAQISCNLSANSVPFGHDSMSLSPTWINIRRGSIICLIVGLWALVPWYLVSTAGHFLTFMNAYGCFVCAILSIMIADYWLVRRRKLDVPALYNPHGRYRFRAGFNWRAAAVQLIFMGLCLPGVIHLIAPSIRIPLGLERLFHINWFVNTIGPLVIYWALNYVFPHRISQINTSTSVVSGQREEEQGGHDTQLGSPQPLKFNGVCKTLGAEAA
ncbi:Ff.00g085140.m01.CDS01 [Fusarium sp. VM40]|nr:Ff.00g085140.m01.CDS01 [Fusarium sp. VM40]